MAIIKKDRMFKNVKNHKINKEADCVYSSFSKDNKKYFQFDILGSRYDESTKNVRQTVQFDKDTAEYLIRLLRNEFKLYKR